MSTICMIAIDSPNHIESIYTQILCEELQLNCRILVFNPLTNRRQTIKEIIQAQEEDYIFVIGSAEMYMGKILCYAKAKDTWILVSKDDLVRASRMEKIE